MGAATGGAGVAVVVVRVVVLLATAVVAGTGLLRSTVDVTSRRTAVVAWVAAGFAAATDILSIAVAGASVPFAVAQAVLSLAVPALLSRRAAAGTVGLLLGALLVAETASGGSGLDFVVALVYTAAVVAWLGLAVVAPGDRRTGPRWAGIVAGVLVAGGIGQVLLSGVAFDSRLYETGYGLALLAVAALSLVVLVVAVRAGGSRRAYGVGAAAVVAGFLVSSVLAAIPQPPPPPTPGTPLLARVSLAGRTVPVLVTPQRPGRNLVHFPPGAGTGLTVGTGSGAPVPALARPGAEGTWAEVVLPAGRGRLVVGHGGRSASVALDTGGVPGPASAAGPDGPECADAALGSVIAGHPTALTACPSDTLAPGDERALRALVGYLASRHTAGIALDGDGSPRSVRAQDVVRTAAAADHVPVTSTHGAGDALVVVSGWARGSARLSAAANLQATGANYGYGLYLAPWLLNPPIVNSVPSSSLPLDFDPRVSTSLSYSVAVENEFGGENATSDGFHQWLAAQGQPAGGTGVQIYAAAQVDAMPMNDPEMGSMAAPRPGQWVPNGTIVPISGVLQG